MKKDLIKKNKVELEKELADMLVSLRSIRFGVAGGKSKNVKEYASIKKGIAQIKTTLRNLN